MFQIKRNKIYIKSHSNQVNFIVGGTQKAGTTALYHYLKQHQEIGMARKKELHYFNNENAFAKPYILYSRYEKYFDFNSGKKVYGEATPSYIYWESACRRIWNYNPRMKLIFILRNPVDRAFSSWNMEVDRGVERYGFYESVRKERERIHKKPISNRKYCYIYHGFYAEQIRRYRQFFPDNQLKFIKYEKFKTKQEETLRDIFSFLKVDPDLYTFEYKTVHKRPKHDELSPGEREYLVDIFKNNIKEVEKLLGWDCSDWLATS